MTKDNGGPAFPCEVVPKYDGFAHDGMTMRDWFAGMALQGMISNPSLCVPNEDLAFSSYAIADAMLKERKK